MGFDRIEIPVGRFTFSALAAGPDTGRMVFLLHGFPQSSSMWRHQLDALAARGYRAVAPDQRGYSPGARPDDVGDYAVEHLVEDVVAMADWFSANQIDLVGHDWGAAIAWQLAARYPDRLRSLTAVSVPHPAAFGRARSTSGDQQERSSYIGLFQQEGKAEEVLLADDARRLRSMLSFPGARPEDVEAHVRLLTEPGALTAALSWYRAMTGPSFAPAGTVTVPTLYVWSTGDVAIGRDAAEGCAEFVEGPYRFEVLEGITHWIPEEAPDRLNELLLAHLGSTS